jgi:hypothetical protein
MATVSWRRAAVLALFGLSLCGCGSGGSNSTASSTSRTSAKSGAAAADAFICLYKTAKHKTAKALGFVWDYLRAGQLRASASTGCDVKALPKARMKGQAETTAAAIITRYAVQVAAREKWSPAEIAKLKRYGL